MSFSVETTPHFDKEVKRLAKKYSSLKSELSALFKSLQNNPTQGTHIGRDIYKIRLAISSKGKGKRGGARLISFVKKVNNIIYLVSIYSKGEKNDISIQEIQKLLDDI